MFDALAADVVTRRAIELGKPFVLPGGLTAELFAVPGKVPLYLERGTPQTAAETGANVGVEISADGARLCFVPGAAAVTPALRARLRARRRRPVRRHAVHRRRDDRAGTGEKTGRRMGHMPIDGADGSLAALDGPWQAAHLHPHQQHQSDPDRRLAANGARVEAAGWEVAADGLEIAL